jgi:hypothetical protein
MISHRELPSPLFAGFGLAGLPSEGARLRWPMTLNHGGSRWITLDHACFFLATLRRRKFGELQCGGIPQILECESHGHRRVGGDGDVGFGHIK